MRIRLPLVQKIRFYKIKETNFSFLYVVKRISLFFNHHIILFKKLCLLLLTVFLICKATDVASILLAKEKAKVVCIDGTCDNENTEVEKMIDDDQILLQFAHSFQKSNISVPLKTVFSYTIACENEIYKNLFSPPPELS